MFKSIFQINSKLIFTAIFCLITSVSYAADSTATKSQKSQSQPNSIESKPSSLSEWFYKELSSIQKEVSVLDATGATKESIRELKSHLAKVELDLENYQSRVINTIGSYDARISDLHASSERSLDTISWATTWFSAIAAVLGVLITVIVLILSFRSKKEAIASARSAVDIWVKEKESEIKNNFDMKLKELDENHQRKEVEINKKFEKQAEEHEIRFEEIQDEAKLQAANNEINEAYSLAKNDKSEQALQKINEIIRKFKNIDKTKYQVTLAKSLLYKGLIFDAANESDRELQVYDELIKLFKDSNNVGIQRQVATSLMYKGITLGELKRSEEAVETYAQLVELFGESKELVLQEQVAKALINKGITLGELKRSEDELETYAQLVELFGESKELVLQEQVAKALSNKAELVLVNKDKNEAKNAIAVAIAFLTDNFSVNRTVMEFFNFILKEVELDSVMTLIDKIPDDEKQQCEFEIIKPVIEQLEPLHKDQVKAIVHFFEEHQNKEQLKAELADISSK